MTTTTNAAVSPFAPEVVSTPPDPRSGRRWLLSSALLLAAAVLLSLVADAVLVSQVQNTRNQQILMGDFRADLANAIAPVGPTDSDGALLAPGAAVAIMNVRAIGLEQVVVEGTTSGQTMNGPGHKRDTPMPGQAGVSIIMGRQASFGGAFGRLGDLIKGDVITVTTGQGDQQFTVLDVRRAGDPLPPPLASGQGRLVLITADGTPYIPDGVLRVDAQLTSPVQPSSGVVLTAADVAPAEQPMQGDPSAWIGVVLWGQAVLIAALALTWCRMRWGGWQTWVIGVPILGFLGLALANQLLQLMPNLM